MRPSGPSAARRPALGLSGEPAGRGPAGRGGRGRTHRGPQDRTAARPRGRGRCRGARGRAPRCGAGPTRAGATVHLRPFAAADLDGAWLALTATDDPAVNQAVHDAAEERRIWVNSADDPANCSFTLMSVVRRSDLVVAIGTGGRSPALAAHLRRMLDEEFGPEYETLLDLLSEAREALRASGRSSEDADWQAGVPVGHRGPRPGGPNRRGEGALEHVSLIVVGLNHRTVPVELLERMTVPRSRAAEGAARPRGSRAPARRRSCSRRATAPRSTRSALASTPRSATSPSSSPHTRVPIPTTSPTISTRITTTPR